MRENTFWLGIVVTIALSIVAIHTVYEYAVVKSMEYGYCEVQNEGNASTRWVKCEGMSK